MTKGCMHDDGVVIITSITVVALVLLWPRPNAKQGKQDGIARPSRSQLT